MAKRIVGILIIFFINNVLFAQTPLACATYNSGYYYYYNNIEGDYCTEDSTDNYRKISLKLYNATPLTVLKTFKKKYPEYQYINSGDISACYRRDNFIVQEVTLADFLNELKRLYPLDGETNGKTLVVWLKDTAKSGISRMAKKINNKTTPNTNPKANTPLAADTSKSVKPTVSQVPPKDTLVISFTKSEVRMKNMFAYFYLPDTLPDPAKMLDTIYKNGLQIINANKATGAYFKPYKKLLQSAYTNPNIVDRIFNITIPLTKNGNLLQGTMPGSLRGAVSLYGNKSAHVVLDNFGYHNHTDFINPQDIDDVTLIKDAAGGAIWGINSSNGIMALTTKTGISSGLEINLINSFEIGQKPDLDYLAGVNAAERIGLEKQAWSQNGSALVYTPVVDILSRVKNRTLTQSEGDSILGSWQNNNFRKEIRDGFYQLPQRLVHGLSISTGNQKFRLYASLGRDNNRLAEKGNTWNRTTFMTNLSWIDKKFEFTLNPSIASIERTNNFIDLPLNYSYLSLYNRNGNPQAIPWLYSTDLTTNAIQRGFLNWSYVPADEAGLANNTIRQSYYQVNGRLRYNIIKNLSASAFAQYGYSSYTHRDLHVSQSFFTRNLVNLYRQRDNTGRFYWPIPAADILDKEEAVTNFENHRAQIDYKGGLKALTIMATGGFERRKNNTVLTANRTYGDPQFPIDYTTLFDISISPGDRRTIPYRNTRADSINNFFSYYASTYLTWRNKYTVSGNYRADFTNRFSVATNYKNGIGLWSVGAAWNAGEERFMRSKGLSGLKFRVSYGINGNVDYDATPVRVIQPSAPGAASMMATPGSPLLRWEKLHVFNAGVDFFNTFKWLSGNIDYYHKQGKDLMHLGAWNPTTGVSFVRNNSGSLTGQGIDVWLRTKPFLINRRFTYNNDVILAYSTNKVTSPESFSKPASQYLSTYIPVTGYPVDALFAFPVAGFNPFTGAPKGYWKGQPSEEYTKILSAPADSVLSYVGSAVPVTVASLIQSLNYKAFTLSVQLTGRFGYYVRIRATDNLNVFDVNRHTFYQYSTANVLRADNIRLQQLRLAYELTRKYHPRLPFKRMGLNVSVNNVGILYRMHRQVDPDIAIDGYPAGRSFTFTLNITY